VGVKTLVLLEAGISTGDSECSFSELKSACITRNRNAGGVDSRGTAYEASSFNLELGKHLSIFSDADENLGDLCRDGSSPVSKIM
jgi:hypothetical protein